jgi:hypothetical protein
VLLLGFAYLLWLAPESTVLTRRVSAVSATVNGGSAVLILLWVVSGPVGLGVSGSLIMLALRAALVTFALLQAGISGR